MSHRSVKQSPAVVLALLLCAACGSSADGGAGKREGNTASRGSARTAWEPERVEIVDHWYGLEGDTPHNAEYVLTRGPAGAFTGTASLSRGPGARANTSPTSAGPTTTRR